MFIKVESQCAYYYDLFQLLWGIFQSLFWSLFVDSRWIRIFHMEKNEIFPENGRNEIQRRLSGSIQSHTGIFIEQRTICIQN